MRAPLTVFMAIALVVLLPAAGIAQEIGLDLTTSASFAETENSPNFSTKGVSGYTMAAPSFLLPFGTKAELRGQGYVKLSYPTSDSVDLLSYDLQTFEFKLALKNPRPGMDSFVFVAGRSNFADPTGYIVSAPVDMLSFSFAYPAAAFTFSSGYTGFLFNSTSPFTISQTDQNRSADSSELFGSKRFLAQADLEFTRIFGQRVVLSALVQNDVNDSKDFIATGTTTFQAEKGGSLSTQYLSLAASGALGPVSYQLFGSYGIGRILSWLSDSESASGYSYQLAPISSYLAGLTLNMPIEAVQGAIGLRALFASGDKDATGPYEGNGASTYKRFTPLTRTTLGIVFSPYLANLLFVEAGWTTNPDFLLRGFVGSAKYMAFLRPTSGPITESGLGAGSSSPYLGSEVDLSLNYGILSDLGVSLGIGVFLPGVDPAGAFDADYAGSKLQVAGKLAVTLNM